MTTIEWSTWRLQPNSSSKQTRAIRKWQIWVYLSRKHNSSRKSSEIIIIPTRSSAMLKTMNFSRKQCKEFTQESRSKVPPKTFFDLSTKYSCRNSPKHAIRSSPKPKEKMLTSRLWRTPIGWWKRDVSNTINLASCSSEISDQKLSYGWGYFREEGKRSECSA